MRDPGADSETEGKKTLQPHEGGGLQSDNELDKAGQSILRLLHKAAGVTEQKNRYTLEMAQKLSHQVHAAETRFAGLQAEVEICRERAERAEQWLRKVYAEIENRFLR
jgi:hypothetical protein